MARTFQPRSERLDLSFPVVFAADHEILTGHCLNLSESGLLARFDRPLDVWVTGRLRISLDTTHIEIDARVARLVEGNAGFAFLFQSEEERAGVRAMVDFAARHTSLAGFKPPF